MSTKRFLIVASLLAAAMLTVAVAQKAASSGMHPHGMDEMAMGERMTEHLARALNLTDQQKQQVQSIFAAEKSKMQPLMQDLASAHKQIEAGVADGTLDQNQAMNIIEAHKTQFAQMLAERAQVHSEILKILTPEQQTKFKQLAAGHGHMHHGPGVPPNSEQPPAPEQK